MTAAGAPAGEPRLLDLTRLDGGTRAAVMLAVDDLDKLGCFIGAARALVGDWYASPGPEALRTLAGLVEAAEGKVGTLRSHLSDLIAAEALDALDGPAGEADGERVPHSGPLAPMDLWAQAAPASNAVGEARDLSIVLVRALGTYGAGFGRAELAALYTVGGMVAERVAEAADWADALCGMIDPSQPRAA